MLVAYPAHDDIGDCGLARSSSPRDTDDEWSCRLAHVLIIPDASFLINRTGFALLDLYLSVD